jgi:S-formylglutathione hydrolase FrmB
MDWTPIGIWRVLWQGFMHTSIITGWLPLSIEVLTIVMVVASINWRGRHEVRRLFVGAIVATSVMLVTAGILLLGNIAYSNVPPWPFVWAGVGVLTLWIGVADWKRNVEWRRVSSVVAVLLTIVCTLGAINNYRETFITVYRLGSFHPENVLNVPGLQALKEQVQATGKLPANGTVFITDIPPVYSGFQTRKAYIYLPPEWFAKKAPPIPTLILLPGEPGGAPDWSSSGDADTTANAFAATNGGKTPIIIMPDSNGINTEDSECVNSKFGNAETYIAKDIPTFAHSVLGAATGPNSMAIAGLSAGGTCSTMIALNNPDVFSTFASYSGFTAPQYQNTTVQQTIDILFNGSESSYLDHSPLDILKSNPNGYQGMAGWFEAGSSDTDTANAAKTLQPLALRAGISTCILIRPGGHDFLFWAQAFHDSLPWISWRLGLLPNRPDTAPARCESPAN